MTNQITTPGQQALAPINDQNTALLEVISQATMNPEVDVDKMEKLLNMQERVMDKQAEALANEALYQFQSVCPQVERTKQGYGFNYCPYEVMMKQIRPFMAEFGFSERFDNRVNDQGKICAVICTISHRGGHSWSCLFPVEMDHTGSKNNIQAIGSAQSYGRRYSFVGAMGIVIKDEDNDGNEPPPQQAEAKQPKWQEPKAEGEPTNDEEMKTWLEGNGFDPKYLNKAIKLLGRATSWQKMSEKVKADILTQSKLAKLKTKIEELIEDDNA